MAHEKIKFEAISLCEGGMTSEAGKRTPVSALSAFFTSAPLLGRSHCERSTHTCRARPRQRSAQTELRRRNTKDTPHHIDCLHSFPGRPPVSLPPRMAHLCQICDVIMTSQKVWRSATSSLPWRSL